MRILVDGWGDSPAKTAAALRELADRVEAGESTARGGYQDRGYDCQPHPATLAAPAADAVANPYGWNCDSLGAWHFYPRRSGGRAYCGKIRTGGGYVPQRERQAKGNCAACLEIAKARDGGAGAPALKIVLYNRPCPIILHN